MEIYSENCPSANFASEHIANITRTICLCSPMDHISLLLTYDEHDGGRDCAQYDDVVDGHPHQAGVVDLSHLLRTGLVRKEEAKNQLQALVRVNHA